MAKLELELVALGTAARTSLKFMLPAPAPGGGGAGRGGPDGWKCCEPAGGWEPPRPVPPKRGADAADGDELAEAGATSPTTYGLGLDGTTAAPDAVVFWPSNGSSDRLCRSV